ncbi:MAG: hypothetical protein JJU16_03470 [Alkalibacterium sp.]|nr:hypothetical protein [Alkalibacterium sp.]
MLNHYLTRVNDHGSKWQGIIASSIIVLLSVAFVLSDWTYNFITFSEYILFVVMAILILTLNFRISRNQLTVIGTALAILVGMTVVHYFVTEDFVLRTALLGIMKLIFYSLSITVSINYILKKNLNYSFLIINNIAAFIVILLGVYITFELYRETRIPQEIFWRFTRRDIYSYYFESNPAIIRTRSIFSEPAHLGFYLNSLIAVNLFSDYRTKFIVISSFILSLGVLITFSYSMIAILLFIVTLRIGLLIINNNFKWSNWYLVIPIVLVALTIYNWEIVQTTLIQRTLAVFTGQDTSARMRLFDSWQYVSRDNVLQGNGIGHTPVVTNIYAYAVSDLGLVGVGLVLAGTIWIMSKSWTLGLVFILFNSAKGGYLSSGYWLMILVIILYSLASNEHIFCDYDNKNKLH